MQVQCILGSKKAKGHNLLISFFGNGLGWCCQEVKTPPKAEWSNS